MPWVLVRADRGLFALSTCHVQEMVSTPAVTRVPDTAPFVRGVINLRGQVMPLVDLRERFGLPTQAEATQKLSQLLKDREGDHLRWVDELLACVRDKRRFTLTTDPHGCAFGKWYDNFKTDNLLLETVLKRFDEPHRQLHAIGQQIVDAMAAGTCQTCEAKANELKQTVLRRLQGLFADAQAVLHETSREIAVVLQACGPKFAVAVDAIESVERLSREPGSSIEEALGGARSECIDAVARRAKDSSLVLTVVAETLLRRR